MGRANVSSIKRVNKYLKSQLITYPQLSRGPDTPFLRNVSSKIHWSNRVSLFLFAPPFLWQFSVPFPPFSLFHLPFFWHVVACYPQTDQLLLNILQLHVKRRHTDHIYVYTNQLFNLCWSLRDQIIPFFSFNLSFILCFWWWFLWKNAWFRHTKENNKWSTLMWWIEKHGFSCFSLRVIFSVESEPSSSSDDAKEESVM